MPAVMFFTSLTCSQLPAHNVYILQYLIIILKQEESYSSDRSQAFNGFYNTDTVIYFLTSSRYYKKKPATSFTLRREAIILILFSRPISPVYYVV